MMPFSIIRRAVFIVPFMLCLVLAPAFAPKYASQAARLYETNALTERNYIPLVFSSSTVAPPALRPTPQPTSQPKPSDTASFLYTFDGAPSQPQPFASPDWDVAVHSRDATTWSALEPMAAEHGQDCSGPPATHAANGAYDQAVFMCRDHVMTALKASGYGVIYLTPDRLVDFSQGEAVIRFDLSTLRSSFRDWPDVWISPFEDNVQLPFDQGEVDLQGVPRNAVHLQFDSANGNGTNVRPVIYKDFKSTDEFRGFSNDYNWFTGYETFLTPSASRRDTFEIRLSRTHIKAGMPAYNFWWVDKDISPLTWTRGVVQFGHHSYNPVKPDGCGLSVCAPTTWHWDNVSISPAKPFTIIHADQRAVTDDRVVQFQRPAPANTFLRFSGIGSIQVSVDGGQTWQPARKQPSSTLTDGYHPEHMSNFWTPVAAGTQQVRFRFSPDDWYQGPYIAKDFALWSLSSAP